jgi:hypothetical protein
VTPAENVKCSPGATSSNGVWRRRSRSRLDRGVGQHQQKLLATPARHHVAPAQLGLDPVREAPQHLVTARVTMFVVDALEVVQVDQRQRQRQLPARLAGGFCRELVEHGAAVGQTGQIVTRRQLADA